MKEKDKSPGHLSYWAEMWWCGDDVCDCSNPQIHEYYIPPSGKKRIRTVVYGNTWMSGYDKKDERLIWDEMKELAVEYEVSNLKEILDKYNKIINS